MPRNKYDFTSASDGGPAVTYRRDISEISIPSSSNGKDIPMVEVVDKQQLAKVPYPNSQTPRNDQCPWGWIIGALLGMASMAFILVVALAPPPGWVPRHIDIMGSNKTFYKIQGALVVYPNLLDQSSNSYPVINYHFELADINSTVIDGMRQLLEEYLVARERQDNNSESYALCYLEDPRRERPCFFDLEWLDQDCSPSDEFGYQVINGKMNPCLFFRVEQTKDWTPVVFVPNNQTLSAPPLDPHSIQVVCQQKQDGDTSRKKIQIRPHKGFLPHFFPIEAFDPKTYLHPLVSVQVLDIGPGDNVTIECQLAAHNTFMLHGSGLVRISFTYNDMLIQNSDMTSHSLRPNVSMATPVNETSAENATVFPFEEREV